MAAFPVTPLLGAAPVLVAVLIANGAIATWAMLSPRGATPSVPSRPTRGALLTAGAIALALVIAAATWYGTADRVWPPAIGILAGAFGLALLPAAAHDDDLRPELIAFAGGLAALAALALALGVGVPIANAAIGLLTGAAATGTALRLAQTDPGVQVKGSAGLAGMALVAGAGAWGDKLWPTIAAGWPLALALGTAAVGALALGLALTGPDRSKAATLAPPAAFALAALPLGAGLFGASGPLLAAIVAGAVGAALLPTLLASRPDLAALGKLAFLVAGGALLVVDNRLLGIVAIGFGGIGLLAGLAAGAQARIWLGLLAAVFAARVWIQLFLDRTALTGYGVDLTHPYAFAALIGGALVPAAAQALRRAAGGHAGLAGAAGVVLALAPAAVGYFIHVEAMGAWLAGLALATFAAAALERAEDGPTAAPVLLLANVGVVLLAAPWLVSVMNVTRQARVSALLALALALAVLAVWWWLTRGRAGQAPAQVATEAPAEG